LEFENSCRILVDQILAKLVRLEFGQYSPDFGQTLPDSNKTVLVVLVKSGSLKFGDGGWMLLDSRGSCRIMYYAVHDFFVLA